MLPNYAHLYPPDLKPVATSLGNAGGRQAAQSQASDRTHTDYDASGRPTLSITRSPTGNLSKVYYDPATGRPKRLCEALVTSEGHTVNRETIYGESGRLSEVASTTSSSGQLLSIVERQYVGCRVVFYGESHYAEGLPTVSVNQHLSPETGELLHREQIHWLAEGRPAMTEHFYFASANRLKRYVKVLHYTHGGSFSEEIQELDPLSGRLVKRQLAAFSQEGGQICLDILDYAADGTIENRITTYFDASGQPVAGRDFS